MRNNKHRSTIIIFLSFLICIVIALTFTLFYIISMDSNSAPKIKRVSIEENYHDPVRFYPTFESRWEDRLLEAEKKEATSDNKGYPEETNSNKITSDDEGYPNGDDWSEKGKAIAEDITEFLMDIPW